MEISLCIDFSFMLETEIALTVKVTAVYLAT